MTKYLLFLLIIFSCNSVLAVGYLDSLLQVLDVTLEKRKTYAQLKENRIQELRERIGRTASLSIERYDLNMLMFQEYEKYSSDSALHYLTENIALAQQIEDNERVIETRLKLSYLLTSMGMYLEASDILRSVDRQQIPLWLLGNYFKGYEHLYSEVGVMNSRNSSLSSYYLGLSRSYQDSLVSVLDPQSDICLYIREAALRKQAKYSEALEINSERLSKAVFGTSYYALVAYQRFYIFREIGDVQKQQYYLTLAAISDLRAAGKEQSALMRLALLLYKKKDMERAYTYMNCFWEEVRFYNARMRNWTSIGPLSMINGTYLEIINQQNRKLQTYIICVAFLVLLLIIALIYIYRQMKALAVAKKGVQRVNERLSSLNEELELVNKELRSANLSLSESNEIKEAYIARFFKLCSTYVDRLETYRKLVNKKIQKGQIADLLKMTRPGNDILATEVQELYANFDSAFLHLFPDFVDSFNKLLLPEERIIVKEGELLNTELRIFALIRLGIKDSSQIAELLHYSVNTIYNYRARVKNKALVSREDFEDLIAGIR